MLKDCENLTQNKSAPVLEGGGGMGLEEAKGSVQFSSYHLPVSTPYQINPLTPILAETKNLSFEQLLVVVLFRRECARNRVWCLLSLHLLTSNIN